MPFAQDLAGRQAVVTGGAGGLGRAIAVRLAASGATVAIVDLPEAMARAPADHTAVPLDLAAPDAPERLSALAGRLGTVDIVVANAGVVPPWRGIAALDAMEWQRVMAVNVWGVAATLQAFAPALAQSRAASVVVMASINGLRAHPDQVLYTTSKHAVVGLTRAAALDLGRQGIRVNALAPGPIATEALTGRVARRHAEGGPAPEVAMAALAAETALGRIATEADVANAAHFLASDASGGMTGAILPIEAGLA